MSRIVTLLSLSPFDLGVTCDEVSRMVTLLPCAPFSMMCVAATDFTVSSLGEEEKALWWPWTDEAEDCRLLVFEGYMLGRRDSSSTFSSVDLLLPALLARLSTFSSVISFTDFLLPTRLTFSSVISEVLLAALGA